jgi:uncharacterized protein (TIGR02284 family)
MAEPNKKTIRTLNRLHRLCHAGQRGFQTVAENAQNRGLKVLLKSFAQQRADFAEEISEEVERLGGRCSERRSVLGVIHRGRINIRATMTISARSVEDLILREARYGEGVAEKAYQKALESDLPAGTRALVEGQYHQIKAVREQIERLQGKSGRQLVVRLFDSTVDAHAAIDSLQQAGFATDAVELIDMEQIKIYNGPGSSLNESAISGAVGGALWGGLFGLAAGLSTLFVPGMTMIGRSVLLSWAAVALTGVIVGALFGVILGLVIAQANKEEDRYLYDSSLNFGTTLLQMETSQDRAVEATRILHEVNAAARARAVQEAQAAEIS